MTQYARNVVEGRIVAGRLVRLAGERHLRDLRTLPSRGYRFSPEHADHVLEFFPRYLRLYDAGEKSGQPFQLGPAWVFIIGSLFGWQGPDGFRRFRTGYIEMGKGNAKTPALAGLGLYGITCDNEPGAQVFAAATTREQAKVLYEDAKSMAEVSPELLDELIVGENNIAHPASRSFLRPVSSEGRSLDAKRVHFALVDELHEHPDAIVVNKLRAGTKARRQPLVLEITNSGWDRTSICWQHHEASERILEQLVEDESWFGYICQLDPCEPCRDEGYRQPKEGCEACDDYRDEAVWPKVAPNLDISLPRKYLHAQVKESIDLPATRDLILRLNFCMWTSSHLSWIPADRWRSCSDVIPDADLVGVPCFGGLDLGQNDDISAFMLWFELPDGRIAVRGRYWLPEAIMLSRPKRPYEVWRRAGLLVLTEGDSTDQDLVEREVAAACHRWGVRQLAYDKRFAEQMRLHFEGEGIVCVDTPQGYQLNEAITKISGLVKKRQLCHGGDPVLAWAVANVVLRRGQRQEVRLDKDRSGDKIDPVAALAMAGSRAIVKNTNEPRITVIG